MADPAIEGLLEERYKAYAMYVVLDRAIPDVRDGLKPVQRRILYAMHDMGLHPTSLTKKSARIVGEAMGKYHPHGDQSIYDAMTRMAQDFTMRGILVDGQGNFGSADGDSAAAMRYTEARLSPLGAEMLADIDKDTVDWGDNFDTTLKEPTVLPTRVPNLLLNGGSGIAVGIATSIPPHNLGELCRAVIHLCKNWDKRGGMRLSTLTNIVLGPDLPTGGKLYRYRYDAEGNKFDAIEATYRDGIIEGGLVCEAVAEIVPVGNGKHEIVVTELPYNASKLTIMERIGKARDKFPGVTDVRDESDREHGMRLIIETGRGADPKDILERLYAQTKMRSNVSYNAVGISRDDSGHDIPVEGMSLKFMLEQFILHRIEVVLRRARYELDKAEKRLHIVEGLLKAVDALDEVIAIVRHAESREESSEKIQKKLKVTEIQASAILSTQIGNLARLDVKKLKDERDDLKTKITEFKAIIGSEAKRLEVIVEETKAIEKKFATPRKTKIIDAAQGNGKAIAGKK